MMIGSKLDNRALYTMLETLADNKQALGRRYAYWCTGAPALEAAVAAAAMTQDELGHARTLYPLLEDFVQAEEGQIDPTTRTLRYHLAALDEDFADWSGFVAANFLIDKALTIFFAAAQRSSFEALGARARKIVQEEQLHGVYAEGWVRRLAKVGGAVRQGLHTALAGLWDETLCWFGSRDDAVVLQLVQEGAIDAGPDELRTRWLHVIMPVLHELDLEMPAKFDATTKQWILTRELPWERWNATSRRLENII